VRTLGDAWDRVAQVPPQLSLYMSMQPEEKINYSIAGPGGPAKFEAGVSGFETSFRGLNVVRAMPFETSDESDAVQMLQRQTQVGEYYYIGAPDVPPGKTAANTPIPTNYDTIIYDEDSDTLKRIKFLDAFDWLVKACVAAGAPDEDDAYFGIMLLCGVLTSNFDATNQDAVARAAARTDAFVAGTAGAQFATARLGPATEITNKVLQDHVYMLDLFKLDGVTSVVNELNNYASFRAHIATGAYVPIKLVIARPFIEHLTMSAIITVAGSDTGATLFGPSDMQLAANTSTKVIEGHYT
jgi:hypothetical protein